MTWNNSPLSPSKKRINICNHKPSQTFKGANEYDKQNYFNNEKD